MYVFPLFSCSFLFLHCFSLSVVYIICEFISHSELYYAPTLIVVASSVIHILSVMRACVVCYM